MNDKQLKWMLIVLGVLAVLALGLAVGLVAAAGDEPPPKRCLVHTDTNPVTVECDK